ncbi:Kinase, PEK [Giardia muris]|uniref:Kinase, PEK n=1 Tax=Giardia muris TaxID=5742 RepID=A0A4Z1TC63_GIAMU|nr:Kinase, PEK [Giardia muris]|eukprot:TNJ30149.1 Kinase, PEK [Giardia muris]
MTHEDTWEREVDDAITLAAALFDAAPPRREEGTAQYTLNLNFDPWFGVSHQYGMGLREIIQLQTKLETRTMDVYTNCNPREYPNSKQLDMFFGDVLTLVSKATRLDQAVREIYELIQEFSLNRVTSPYLTEDVTTDTIPLYLDPQRQYLLQREVILPRKLLLFERNRLKDSSSLTREIIIACLDYGQRRSLQALENPQLHLDITHTSNLFLQSKKVSSFTMSPIQSFTVDIIHLQPLSSHFPELTATSPSPVSSPSANSTNLTSTYIIQRQRQHEHYIKSFSGSSVLPMSRSLDQTSLSPLIDAVSQKSNRLASIVQNASYFIAYFFILTVQYKSFLDKKNQATDDVRPIIAALLSLNIIPPTDPFIFWVNPSGSQPVSLKEFHAKVIHSLEQMLPAKTLHCEESFRNFTSRTIQDLRTEARTHRFSTASLPLYRGPTHHTNSEDLLRSYSMYDRSEVYQQLLSYATGLTYELLRASPTPLKRNSDCNAKSSMYRRVFSERRCLGKGCYGEVFYVCKKLENQEYAIKKIRLRDRGPPSEASNQSSLFQKGICSLLDSIRRISSLSCPYIINYYYCWTEAVQLSNPSGHNIAKGPDQSCMKPLTSGKGGLVDSNDTCTASKKAEIPLHEHSKEQMDWDQDRDQDDSMMKTGSDLQHDPIKLERGDQSLSRTESKQTDIQDSCRETKENNAKARPNQELSHSHDHTTNDTEQMNMLYIQMEYCDNGTLSDLIRRQGTTQDVHSPSGLSLTDFLWQITAQLIIALAVVHDNELVHYNIKPSNILLDTGYTARLGDFGFGSQFDDIIVYSKPDDSIYLAPEISMDTSQHAQSLLVDNSTREFYMQADIYSLGVTLLELWFVPSSLSELKDIVIQKGPDRFPSHFHETHRELCDLLASMLEPDGTKRPTASDLVSKLGSLSITKISRLLSTYPGMKGTTILRCAKNHLHSQIKLGAVKWNDFSMFISSIARHITQSQEHAPNPRREVGQRPVKHTVSRWLKRQWLSRLQYICGQLFLLAGAGYTTLSTTEHSTNIPMSLFTSMLKSEYHYVMSGDLTTSMLPSAALDHLEAIRVQNDTYDPDLDRALPLFASNSGMHLYKSVPGSEVCNDDSNLAYAAPILSSSSTIPLSMSATSSSNNEVRVCLESPLLSFMFHRLRCFQLSFPTPGKGLEKYLANLECAYTRVPGVQETILAHYHELPAFSCDKQVEGLHSTRLYYLSAELGRIDAVLHDLLGPAREDIVLHSLRINVVIRFIHPEPLEALQRHFCINTPSPLQKADNLGFLEQLETSLSYGIMHTAIILLSCLKAEPIGDSFFTLVYSPRYQPGANSIELHVTPQTGEKLVFPSIPVAVNWRVQNFFITSCIFATGSLGSDQADVFKPQSPQLTTPGKDSRTDSNGSPWFPYDAICTTYNLNMFWNLCCHLHHTSPPASTHLTPITNFSVNLCISTEPNTQDTVLWRCSIVRAIYRTLLAHRVSIRLGLNERPGHMNLYIIEGQLLRICSRNQGGARRTFLLDISMCPDWESVLYEYMVDIVTNSLCYERN